MRDNCGHTHGGGVHGHTQGPGGKYRLSDIGIDESLKPEVLDISSAIRNRLTLARMRRVLDFGED